MVINIRPVSRNINTTTQTLYGEVVPSNMYRSGFLLEVYNGWLNIGVHPIRFFGPETFLKQIGQ